MLEKGLEAAWTTLKRGGRLAVITFQSLEVRKVREFGRKLEREYVVDGELDLPELRRPVRPQLRWVNRKGITPGEKELSENPRARSAQLRVMEKIGNGEE